MVATEFVYNYVKDKRTVGAIREFPERGLVEVAEPIGIILSLTPITNPTSTVLFKCIMVCTNVPGPQYPLYLLGHKMTHWYPYVPIGGELAMNCAILSYDGMIYFGFSGDAHAAPDVARLEKFLSASFEELREAAGLNCGRKKAPRRTPRKKSPPVDVPRVVAKTAVPTNGTALLPTPLPRVQPAEDSSATKHPVAKEKPAVLQETA